MVVFGRSEEDGSAPLGCELWATPVFLVLSSFYYTNNMVYKPDNVCSLKA